MGPRPTLERLLRTGGGRIRLGWRIVLFTALAVALAGAATPLLPGGLLGPQAAVLLGAVVAGVALLRVDGRPAAALGFPARVGALSEAAAGLALGTGVALLVVLAIALLGGLRWSPQGGSSVAWLLGAGGALSFLAIPAAAEEALLRGYPLQALAESWGPWAAVFATSATFGLLHALNPNLTVLGSLNIGLAGVFLAIVFLRTGSLWWASGTHLGWNWAHGYVADVPVSGLELLDAPLYEGVVRGPAWLGGGDFGPEGSVLATLVLAVASVVCWRARWLRPTEATVNARPLALVRSEP